MDIDKLYLLAVSILNNGSLTAGTALQKYIGYKYASKLYSPNGEDIVSGNGKVKISGEQLNRFNEKISNWSDETNQEFVNTLNAIGKSKIDGENTIAVNFENTLGISEQEFNKQVERFLRLANKHSKTKSHIRDSMDALKSKVFSGIYDVTTFAQNQLKAQIMVDACTGELKSKAAKTTGGQAEKLISPDNPASKYVMQEQCMLGKAVVGIGAVSLKTYFMLSTMANRMVDNCIDALHETDNMQQNLSSALSILRKMSLNGPNGLTTIANTNLKKILRAFNKLDESVKQSTTGHLFENLLNELMKNQTKISAPEFLSGIISLAADNAKDLALPKLNATADLVDIYTTAAMIGISFEDISNIMTSPIFNWMTKAGYDDIFDNSTKGNKVKNMVAFASYNLSYFEKVDIKQLVISRNNWAAKNNLNIIPVPDEKSDDWSKYLSDPVIIDAMINYFESKGGLIDTSPEKIVVSEEESNMIQDMQDAAADTGYTGEIKVDLGYTKADAYIWYRKFQKYNDLLKYQGSAHDLAILSKLIEIGKEMTAIGQQGQINQGMKTNTRDFLAFKQKIERLVNDREQAYVKAHNYSLKKGEKKIEAKTFEIDNFFKDRAYRNEWIEHYESYLKSGFNVLRAIAMSPNFFNMSKLVTYANEILKCSYTYRTFSDIYNKLLADGMLNSISESDASQIMSTINDGIIYNFIKTSGINIDLSKIDSDVEIYTPDLDFDLRHNSVLELNTVENIASFKHIMESIIIPKLKTDPRYKNNSFVRDLGRTKDKFDRISFSLPIQMMDIDSEPSLQERYGHYLNDFNTLSKDSIYGLNLGSMFFLYNLIAYKNGYGQNSLTRIFEDLIDSKDRSQIIDSYYKWIGKLDSVNSSGAKRADIWYDVLYKIKNYSKGANLKLGKTKIKDRFKLNSDFTFELPYETKLNESKWINNEAYLKNITTFEHIDPIEAVETIARTFRHKYNAPIEIITDSEAEKIGEPKARGFVKDGKIYLNKSKFNNVGNAIGVATHELSHLVLAAMKVNPDLEVRRNFYNLIQLIKTDPETERYAQAYSNLVGSDLYEEIIASKIGKLISNRINSNSNIELHIVNNEMLLDAFDLLFDTNKTTLRDIAGSNLEQLIENFAGNLFDFSNEIKSDFINEDQHLSAVKTRLYNSDSSDYNLKQDCK